MEAEKPKPVVAPLTALLRALRDPGEPYETTSVLLDVDWDHGDMLLHVDRALAGFIDWLEQRTSVSVLVTSDHGEAFREHWQLGHTSALYDEEIHVPGWIDAPPGTLGAAGLRAREPPAGGHQRRAVPQLPAPAPERQPARRQLVQGVSELKAFDGRHEVLR